MAGGGSSRTFRSDRCHSYRYETQLLQQQQCNFNGRVTRFALALRAGMVWALLSARCCALDGTARLLTAELRAEEAVGLDRLTRPAGPPARGAVVCARLPTCIGRRPNNKVCSLLEKYQLLKLVAGAGLFGARPRPRRLRRGPVQMADSRGWLGPKLGPKLGRSWGRSWGRTEVEVGRE